MMGCKCTCRLSAISIAIAMGVVSALWMCLFAWSAYMYGHGVAMVAQWGEIFRGYAPTINGGLIGAAWGFVDGFVCGLVFAWIYNLCLCCCKMVCRSDAACVTMDETVVVKKTKKM